MLIITILWSKSPIVGAFCLLTSLSSVDLSPCNEFDGLGVHERLAVTATCAETVYMLVIYIMSER